MRPLTTGTRGAVLGGGLLAVAASPLAAYLTAAAALALFAGVVLPAVWSADADRRAAAYRVLRLLRSGR